MGPYIPFLCGFVGLSVAFILPPKCRLNDYFPYTYPYVGAQTECGPYSHERSMECQKFGQFGFEYRSCDHPNFQCRLSQSVPSAYRCPDNRVLVKNVTLRHHFPVDISLNINVPGGTQDIIILVDASQSTRAKLDNAKAELKSFVRTLGDIGNVSVAYYGGERDMGKTGYSVHLKATADVNKAADAIDDIPIVADGPRTSLTAMYSVMQHEDGTKPLGLFATRRIIVLVGDTPGREPDCRYGLKSHAMGFISQRTRVMVVNLAAPGLNAALTAPEEGCEFHAPASIAQGQGTKIASTSNGELISEVTSAKLRASILKLRMNDARNMYGKGTHISVLSKTYTSAEYTCPSSMCERTIRRNGCDERVILRTSNIPAFAHGPVQMTGKISLSLPAGICQRGPFYCEVEISEKLEAYSYSVRYMQQKHTQLIGVKACQ